MKVTLSSTPIVKDIKPYPKLMISSSGTIVLFTEKSTGFLISGTSEKYIYSKIEIGSFSSTWIDNVFVDYEGSVTLSND